MPILLKKPRRSLNEKFSKSVKKRGTYYGIRWNKAHTVEKLG